MASRRPGARSLTPPERFRRSPWGVRLPAAACAPCILVRVWRADRNVVLVSGIRLDRRVAEVDDGRRIGIVRIRRVLLADSYGGQVRINRLAGAHVSLLGCLQKGYSQRLRRPLSRDLGSCGSNVKARTAHPLTMANFWPRSTTTVSECQSTL